jgi:hypothetical protein
MVPDCLERNEGYQVVDPNNRPPENAQQKSQDASSVENITSVGLQAKVNHTWCSFFLEEAACLQIQSSIEVLVNASLSYVAGRNTGGETCPFLADAAIGIREVGGLRAAIALPSGKKLMCSLYQSTVCETAESR